MKISTALALLLSCAVASLQAAPKSDELQAYVLADSLLAVTGLLPSHALILELKRLADDRSQGVETRERALSEYAFRLRDYAPDPSAWAALEFLSGYTERAVVPHPEASAFLIPQFHIATTARGTLNAWMRDSARERAAGELAAGHLGFILAIGPHSHPQQVAGFAAAVREAEPAHLAAAREVLIARYPDNPSLAPMVLAAAAALDDESLLDRVIEGPPSALRFRSVYALESHLGIDRARQRWLQMARGSDALSAGAAIAALADKAPADGELFALLAGRLADGDIGLASAQALGRLHFPSGIPRLAAMLQSKDTITAARAALALKLNGSPAALAALRASPLEEVRKWLQ